MNTIYNKLFSMRDEISSIRHKTEQLSDQTQVLIEGEHHENPLHKSELFDEIMDSLSDINSTLDGIYPVLLKIRNHLQ